MSRESLHPFVDVHPCFERLLAGGTGAPSVFMIEGPRGTFKSTLATSFIAARLKMGESALLIRLSDQPLFSTPGIRHVLSCALTEAEHPFKWEAFKHNPGSKKEWDALGSDTKTVITMWQGPAIESREVRLIEVDFKSGALLPEEFVEIVGAILRKQAQQGRPIKCVVLEDVSIIGVSYPLLRASETTGDLFLSTFVHLMRNYGVYLVMTGTTGELGVANESVHRAVLLADDVISCDFCSVYGDRYVIVRGDGLMAEGVRTGGHKEPPGECVPAVVRWVAPLTYTLDMDYLRGFVGFETGDIHRPGISVHLFQEYPDEGVHKRYNDSISTILVSAFGRSGDRRSVEGEGDRQAGDVSVVTFSSTDSDAMHGSVGELGTGPLDRTVVCTVDEFFLKPTKPESPTSLVDLSELSWPKGETRPSAEVPRGMPYYNNVLLLAYRRDLLVERASDVWFPSGRPADDRGIQEWVLHSMRDKRSEDAGVVVPTGSWHHVVTLADSLMHATREGRFRKGPEWGGAVDGCPIRRAFCYDQSARETLACALIDALVVGRRGSDPALSINDAFFKGLPDPLPETVIGEVVALSDLFSMTNQVTSRYPLFEVADVLDAEGLLGELSRSKEGAFLSHLSGRMTRLAAMKRGSDTIAKREALVSDLNELLLGESLWSSKLLANVPLSEEILTLLGRAPQGVELIRLNRLILEAVCSGRISKGGKPAIGAAPRSVLELPSDSGVYLCWYSELRDLIDREPALATRLEVIPLPAGGFTGDWFLGIAQGSVSVSLGQKVLSLLSTRQHQYRRFREGVGLPVLDEFYDGRGDFYAWPRGLHVPLSRIGIIHKKALRRSRIESYYLFHAALTTIAERLTPLPSTSGGAAYSRWGDGLPDAEAQRERRVRILENIRRLKGQIAVLKGDPLP